MVTEARQVDGDHYSASIPDFQHWDWVECLSVPYLEGCATKYLVRWRRKDGVSGLRKAHSYVSKILQLHEAGLRYARVTRDERALHFTGRLIQAYGLTEEEAELMHLVTFWLGSQDLQQALSALARLIDEQRRGELG